MFHFVTGDLLQSEAQALVNTVNCEGYMGKGIAYQFKLKFPDMNADYVRVCKRGDLRPGTLHHYMEQGKVIINFPTKDRWRANSKIEYIRSGLDSFVQLLPTLGITSVAIPPLGCGNGGLQWAAVKPLVLDALSPLSATMEIHIYEPLHAYPASSYVHN